MEEIKVSDKVAIRIIEVDPKNEIGDAVPEIIRLTPTGKVSHAKTRVYTQRYRKEWEYMSDFKDWLASVPDQVTRAYCKFCQRNLHAHRLSLLKHMCTLKHQRAAVQYAKEKQLDSYSEKNHMSDFEEILEEQEESVECYDSSYIQDDSEEMMTENVQEVIEESESDIDLSAVKKIRIEKSQDALAEAMADVDEEYITENDDQIQLQMECSDQDDQEDGEIDIKHKIIDDDHVEAEKERKDDECSEVSLAPTDKTISLTSDKMYFLSSNGKAYTLVKGNFPPVLLNQIGKKKSALSKVINADSKIKFASEMNLAGTSTSSSTSSRTSQSTKTIIVSNTNNSSAIIQSVLKQNKSIVSTHVLETSKGVPVNGLQVSLYKLQDGRWTFIHESFTSASGTCDDFSLSAKHHQISGRYKLHYDVEKYYTSKKIATVYPFIEIVFDIKNPNAPYHVPLLLSPFSYSTYKDSSK